MLWAIWLVSKQAHMMVFTQDQQSHILWISTLVDTDSFGCFSTFEICRKDSINIISS